MIRTEKHADVEKRVIVLSDDEASATFGDDWAETFADNPFSIFYGDGEEFYPIVEKNGVFDRLRLVAVY